METILKADSLAIGHRSGRGARVVRADLDLSLHAGELVCLVGPNGAGKSTLLRTLAGLQLPLSGSILVRGEPLGSLSAQRVAQRIAIVLTEAVPVPAMSVRELVALGRHPHTSWSGRLGAADSAAVDAALELSGMKPLADRLLVELSDGERQKAMIARAVAQETPILLLDEPTAYLDLPRRVEILRQLRELTRRARRAVLLSTHDLDLALRSADRIWLMPASGPMHVGAPEDLVLDGSFAAAFATEGIVFDSRHGHFRVHDETLETVCLLGSGDPIIDRWTRHALFRAGFAVEMEAYGRPLVVEVLSADGKLHWRAVADGGAPVDSTSLADIAEHLESARRPALPAPAASKG